MSTTEPIVSHTSTSKEMLVRITQLFNGTAQTNDFFPFSVWKCPDCRWKNTNETWRYRKRTTRGAAAMEYEPTSPHRTGCRSCFDNNLRSRIAFRFKEVGENTDGVMFLAGDGLPEVDPVQRINVGKHW